MHWFGLAGNECISQNPDHPSALHSLKKTKVSLDSH